MIMISQQEPSLKQDAHIGSVMRKVSKKIGAPKRSGISKCDDQRYKAEVLLSSGPIRPIPYCLNAFWTTLSNARKKRRIRASKRGMRAVVDAPTTTSTSSILSRLNIVPLET